MEDAQQAVLEELRVAGRKRGYIDAVHLAQKVGRPEAEVQVALDTLKTNGLVRERRDVVPMGLPAWEITERGRRRLAQ